MILLDLSEIVLRAGMQSTLTVDEPNVEDPDLRFAEPIQGEVVFRNGGELLNVAGELSTVLEIECARCLADVRVPLKVHVDERLPLDQVIRPNCPPADDDEGFDTVIASVIHLDAGRPIMNLSELLRQHIHTEVPIRTLCGAGCLGLCIRCGADLNLAECACPPPEDAGPFAQLASLRLREEGAEQQG